MQNRCVVLFSILFSFCLFSLASAQPIRFAPLPMLSKSEVGKNFQPFAHYLSTITSTDVEIIYHKSYQTLLDGLINDQIDLAYLGPLPYVSLTQQDPSYVPVVRFVNQHGEASYTCALVSFDSPLSKFDSVLLPTVALTQPQSTCGYLVTEQLLQQLHTSLNDLPYYYAGQHSECALEVLRGKAQFAGMKTSIARQYHKLGLSVVVQSDSLPGFLLVANSRTLDGETIRKIRTSLLELNSPSGAVTTASWGKMIRYGAIPVQSSDYDGIRQMVDRIKIPEGDL
jgi:phosphonate transport system substrate-binding protein